MGNLPYYPHTWLSLKVNLNANERDNDVTVSSQWKNGIVAPFYYQGYLMLIESLRNMPNIMKDLEALAARILTQVLWYYTPYI